MANPEWTEPEDFNDKPERGPYEKAKQASAANARKIAFGHPAQWPMPRGEAATDAYEQGLFGGDDDDDYDDEGY